MGRGCEVNELIAALLPPSLSPREGEEEGVEARASVQKFNTPPFPPSPSLPFALNNHPHSTDAAVHFPFHVATAKSSGSRDTFFTNIYALYIIQG